MQLEAYRRITGDMRDTLGAPLRTQDESGHAIRAIAENIGRSCGFVHGVLGESGVTFRGRGGDTRSKRKRNTP